MSEQIQLAGKSISIAEVEEPTSLEDVAEDFVEDEETTAVTLKDLDENSPIENAAKKCFQACLQTGQIPLTATSLRLLLEVSFMQSKTNKRGEVKWESTVEDNEVSTVQLTPADRNSAIEGLANTWLSSMRKILNLQKKYNSEEVSEAVASQIVTAQSEYEKAFSDFKNALKFLISLDPENKKVTEESTGSDAIVTAFSTIQKTGSAWAFEQFMMLPKPYISYAVYVKTCNAAGIGKEIPSSSPVDDDDNDNE